MIERRTTAGLVEHYRQDDDEEHRGVRGMAAVFYDGTPATEYQVAEDLVERIEPTAFEGADMSDVIGVFNHDDSLLLGRNTSRTMSLRLDSTGLAYDIPSIPRSRADVQEYLERGDVQGSSFRFEMFMGDQRFEVEDDGTQVVWVQNIRRLIDVGPVTRPAYSGTSAMIRQYSEQFEGINKAIAAREYDRTALAKYAREKLAEIALLRRCRS